MHWLAQNYQWIFSGIGVLVVSLLLRRWLSQKGDRDKTKSTAEVKNSPLTSSPLASGSNITQTVNAPIIHLNIGQAAAAPPAPMSPNIQPPVPNITLTGARVVRVAQATQGVWSEDYTGEDAFIVQFTNEARSGAQNVGGLVKAQLIYCDAQRELRRITVVG